MVLRVVLYAEGPGEDRGEQPWLPETGGEIALPALGAAHHLVARAVEATGPTRRQVQFVGPVTLLGAPARGSQLLAKKTLRRLLTFASPTRQPDLAVVLVDEDGTDGRRKDLLDWTAGMELPRVVAVPVREFEAWLIADSKALASVLQVSETPRTPESMKPREAKAFLATWIERSVASSASQPARAERIRTVRTQLAQGADLDVLEQLSAWKQFRRDLSDALASLPS